MEYLWNHIIFICLRLIIGEKKISLIKFISVYLYIYEVFYSSDRNIAKIS